VSKELLDETADSSSKSSSDDATCSTFALVVADGADDCFFDVGFFLKVLEWKTLV